MKNKQITVAVIRDKNWNVGRLALVEDLEKVKSEFMSEQVLDIDDIEIITENFDILPRLESYAIIESQEDEYWGEITVPLSHNDAKRLIQLSKQIPVYCEDEVNEAVELVGGFTGKKELENIYW